MATLDRDRNCVLWPPHQLQIADPIMSVALFSLHSSQIAIIPRQAILVILQGVFS